VILVPYVRVSRLAGRDPTVETSAPDQRRVIDAYAIARHHDLTDPAEDFDQPGTKYERPELQRALEMVERGEADGIVVAKLNRLARSVVDGRRVLQRLRDASGSLVIVEEGLDTTTPVGRAMFSILLAFAELEVETIRDTWAVQRADAVDRGVQVARAPIGYVRAKGGTLAVDPKAGPAIREVFLRRAAGASWSTLADFLDERLPKPKGGAWNPQTISKLIRSRTYLGEVSGGSVVNVGAHTALVSRIEWEAAQASPMTNMRARSGSLLAGLLRCESCGHPLTRGTSSRFHTYRCRGRHKDGRCPAPVSIGLPAADTFVADAWLGWARQQHRRLVGIDRGSDASRALIELEAAELQRDRYLRMDLSGVVDEDAFRRGAEDRQREVDEARRRVADAQSLAGLPLTLDVDDLWERSELPARRTLLASAIDSVTVSRAPSRGKGTPIGDRLTIAWRDDIDAPAPSRIERAGGDE
jgi:DNA invertase Pin-like site-specific DNA recombinase